MLSHDLDLIRIMAPKLPEFEQYKSYLARIDENQVYSNFGPLVAKFESEIATYVGVDSKSVVSCANATIGLEGLFSTSQCSQNEVWETPSWTFAATNLAAIRTSTRIKFVDVDEDSRVIPTSNCENIIDVLPFGLNPDFKRYPSKIRTAIVDGAASFDGVKNFPFPKNIRTAVVVSLHATKLMPAGEGGMVFSNDAQWMQRFRQWSNFGFNQDRESEIIGTNAKMSEYAAAIGLASLSMWPADRPKWENIMNRALRISEKYGLKMQPSAHAGYVSPYWIVQLNNKSLTEKLEAICCDLNIETRRWWKYGNHRMDAFGDIPKDVLVNTELIADTTIALPFHLGLTDENFLRIDQALGLLSRT